MRRIVGILLILVCAFSPVESKKRTSVQTKNKRPATSVEAKKKQKETRQEIQQTEAQIRENENRVKAGLAELGKIDRQIETTGHQIQELDKTIKNLNTRIVGLEDSISINEQELERLRAEYLKAVKKMRVTRKNKSTLAYIFSSKSVNQALRRMRYLKEFSKWRERQTSEIEGRVEALKSQKLSLAQGKDEQTRAMAQQKKSQAALASQYAQQEKVVEELKKNGATLQAYLKKKQAEARELDNMISQLIAEEQRKAAEEARRKAEEEARQKAAEEARRRAEEEALQARNETGGKSETTKKPRNEKTSSSSDYAGARKRTPRSNNSAGTTANTSVSSSSGFQAMKGRLSNPATGSFTITSRFGRQSVPDMNDVVYDNPGIDAQTDAGARARAVYKGKVSGVYFLQGYKTVVIVNHGDYYTVYGNISSPAVKTGDEVEEGSTLGSLALNEEDSSHSSIHFEVWKNREKLNPGEWLR